MGMSIKEASVRLAVTSKIVGSMTGYTVPMGRVISPLFWSKVNQSSVYEILKLLAPQNVFPSWFP